MEYICVDLKCFYASVECVERHLDPFTTPLVVADPSRGKGAICLAVSPCLKKHGVKNRCRLYEIDPNIKYIIAKPRMKKYIEYAAIIYECYLNFVSPEDIYVYSIDEVFIETSSYLKMYNKSSIEFGKTIIEYIYQKTGITAACGVGTNLYLCKVALDIEAKKTKDNIAYLDEKLYKEKLYDHTPLTDFWQIGKGIANRLKKYHCYTMKDITLIDEKILYKEFGVNAENLINHAHGIEDCTIKDIKSYLPESNSISSGQIFEKDYEKNDARLALKEMVELLTLDLISKRLVTNQIYLVIGYSHKIDVEASSISYKLDIYTQSLKELSSKYILLFDKIAKDLPIRRINIGFGNLKNETYQTINLFTDEKLLQKEHDLHLSILSIKEKYGKSSILRGMNLEENATTLKRNKLIGGHNSE